MRKLRPGARAIAQAKLQSVTNPKPDRNYLIKITLPEFTCLCPLSGYPDFAVVYVRYVPDRLCVELKSLKLYINSYRDKECFHEAAANRILDDLVALLQPRWMEIVADFNPRGNVKTIIRATHGSLSPECREEEQPGI